MWFAESQDELQGVSGMTGLEVRRAAAQDADAIAHVSVAAWRAAYRGIMSDAHLDGLSVQQRSDGWRRRLSREPPPVDYVAAERGRTVGFISLEMPARGKGEGSKIAEVAALNVHPDAWRSGVGSALMTVALDSFESAGWTTAILWVVRQNARAIAFYTRHGYSPEGVSMVDGTTGVTEIRMRRRLAEPGGAR
jgi:GNAT superfamily N-acetyltransferase